MSHSCSFFLLVSLHMVFAFLTWFFLTWFLRFFLQQVCFFFGTSLGSCGGFDSHMFRLVVGVNKHSAE